MRLHNYARIGDITGVQKELDKGIDIDYFAPQTPLMLAAFSQKAGIEMLQFLVQNGANVNAFNEESEDTVLKWAVRSGNLEKIQFLLDMGADLHYITLSGYDVLINAMFCEDDENLIPLLNFLIAKEAKLNSITIYGESALRIASNIGRFDAINLLLVAGANANQLEWTFLMHTIALGTIEEIKEMLIKDADLMARDFWERTPWLLSLQVGELDKVKFLLCSGANRTDCGRCGKPPLFYAIENNHIELLEWLIAEKFDIEASDDFKTTTPLILAAELGATECVRLLLANGANLKRIDSDSSPVIKSANNLEIVRLLVNAGENLNDINNEMRRLLTDVADNYYELDLTITKEQFLEGKDRRFGLNNPEVMKVDFWQAMIKTEYSAYFARETFDYIDENKSPVWSYNRFGRTITELPDGRIVEIAGEHEDYYDADFCIYNDVVVYQNGDFQIFCYPKSVFPPTDFHTATLIDNFIYIIGSLGYYGQRIYNETPVYRLHLDSFEIERIETTGDKPGWISNHKIYYQEPSSLYITGGKLCFINNDEEEYIDNSLKYVLDLKELTWNRVD